MDSTAVVLPGASAVALALPGDLDFAEWQAAGHVLARVSRASAFWIGDWILHGEDRFGELAAQVVDELGLDVSTIANYRWVAGVFPPSTRQPTLSWRHHLDAAGLPTPEARAELLLRATVEGMSTREVRAEANRLKALAKSTPPSEPPEPTTDNATKLREIVSDVLAQASQMTRDDDPLWFDWQIARGLDAAGVKAP